MTHHTDTLIGTASGTLLAVIALPPATAIVSTIILSAIGALVGYCTTLLCKKIYAWLKNRS